MLLNRLGGETMTMGASTVLESMGMKVNKLPYLLKSSLRQTGRVVYYTLLSIILMHAAVKPSVHIRNMGSLASIYTSTLTVIVPSL